MERFSFFWGMTWTDEGGKEILRKEWQMQGKEWQ